MYLLFTEDDGWHTNQIAEVFKKNNKELNIIKINETSIAIDENPKLKYQDFEISFDKVKGAFVRGIPGGTLEEICFHLDILHYLELENVTVYNNTLCIEKSVDKVRTSCILTSAGIPTPNTFITTNIKHLKNFQNQFLKNDLVCKPIFGSQGKGLEILNKNNYHPDYEMLNNVYYLQEFIEHPDEIYVDWRLFVIENEVIASMSREGSSWINNVASGAICKPFKPSQEMIKLAIDSSNALGMNYAGVDIMLGKDGYMVTEVNSIPAWKGIQSVSENINIAEMMIGNFLKICEEKNVK